MARKSTKKHVHVKAKSSRKITSKRKGEWKTNFSPDEMEQIKRQAARFQEVQDQEREVNKAEAKYLELHAETKTAKKAFDAQVDAMRKLIVEDTDPLFPPQVEGKAKGKGKKAAEPVTPAAPNAWRDVELKDVIGAKFATKMEKQLNIAKLGQLADYTVNGFSKLTDVKGIGEAGAEQIENKILDFWGKHPEFCDGGATPKSDATEVADVAKGSAPVPPEALGTDAAALQALVSPSLAVDLTNKTPPRITPLYPSRRIPFSSLVKGWAVTTPNGDPRAADSPFALIPLYDKSVDIGKAKRGDTFAGGIVIDPDGNKLQLGLREETIYVKS